VRKRTRRKVYPLVNPIQHAIAGAAITDTKILDTVRTLELSALEALRTGHATKEDWRTLADCLNVSETMARDGIGPEAIGANLAAQEALGAIQERSKKLDGRLVVTGPELQALRDGFEYADLQRSSISRHRYEQAVKKTADRIRSAAPAVKVFI